MRTTEKKVNYYIKTEIARPQPQKNMLAMKKIFFSIIIKCVLTILLTVNPPKLKIPLKKTRVQNNSLILNFLGINIFQLRIFVFNSFE